MGDIKKDQIEFSVLIPVCERADTILRASTAYNEALKSTGLVYQVIYIFTETTERYYEEHKTALLASENAEVIILTGSFGEGTAIQIGSREAKGKYILTLPPYLQVEPEELIKLLSAVEDPDVDMAITKRWPRVDGRLNQLQTKLFNGALAKLSNVRYSDLGCGVRVFKKALMEDMEIYGDQHRFLPVIAYEIGATIKEVELAQAADEAPKRYYRPSVYIRRFLDLLSVVFVTKFNKKPLRFFGMLGAVSGFAGMGGLFLVTLQRFFWGVGAADRPLLLVSVLLIALGVQLIAIGLVGETIIFTHAKDIKEYKIKKIIN